MIQRINDALRHVPPGWLYPVGLIPAAWLWYLGLTGGLGPEPINALERELGGIGLKFMVAVLAVTPLRRFAGLNLLRFRRAIGLLAFYYILQHLLVWLALDVGDPAKIWADILKRPYIAVGMAGFAMMLPLAVTSTDRAMRRLGAAKWRELHRLTYAVAVAGVIHHMMLVKGLPLEPLVYAGVVAFLLALRLASRRRTGAIPAKQAEVGR